MDSRQKPAVTGKKWGSDMKSYSKAAKRANKKAVKDLYKSWEAESAPVTPKVEEDPLKAPMQARANQLGQKPTKDVLAPNLETQAGMVLHIGVKDKDERRDLFDTFMEYDKAVNLYSARNLGRQRFPAVSKMEFMPERFETRLDDSPADGRTDEEKADSARKAMRLWDDRLNQLHPYRARIIRSVSYQQETLVKCGEITGAGRSFIAALRALHELTKR